VGIDEDTAIIINYQEFEVIGSGAVYVADGSGISYTNVPTAVLSKRFLCTMSVYMF
jgi:cyanophycinase